METGCLRSQSTSDDVAQETLPFIFMFSIAIANQYTYTFDYTLGPGFDATTLCCVVSVHLHHTSFLLCAL